MRLPNKYHREVVWEMTDKVVPLNEKVIQNTEGLSMEWVYWNDVLESVEGLKKDFVSKLAKHNLTDEQLILLFFHECVDARFGK